MLQCLQQHKENKITYIIQENPKKFVLLIFTFLMTQWFNITHTLGERRGLLKTCVYYKPWRHQTSAHKYWETLFYKWAIGRFFLRAIRFILKSLAFFFLHISDLIGSFRAALLLPLHPKSGYITPNSPIVLVCSVLLLPMYSYD